jgi:hypothetical protein
MSLLIGFYYVSIAIMYFLKALFGIGSLWYIVNGVINTAIISMFLLYFVAFMHSRINQLMLTHINHTET